MKVGLLNPASAKHTDGLRRSCSIGKRPEYIARAADVGGFELPVHMQSTI
jgi:hypothetical protein